MCHFIFVCLLESFSFSLNSSSKGWLSKIGGKVHNWKRRYFILKGEYLYYFRSDAADSTALGSVHLFLSEVKATNLRLGARKAEKGKSGFTMEIVTSGRTYFMRALNKEERDDWIGHLQTAVISGLSLFICVFLVESLDPLPFPPLPTPLSPLSPSLPSPSPLPSPFSPLPSSFPLSPFPPLPSLLFPPSLSTSNAHSSHSSASHCQRSHFHSRERHGGTQRASPPPSVQKWQWIVCGLQ